MSTLLTLRHLSKSVKYTTLGKSWCTQSKIPFVIAPIHNMTPQVKTLTQKQSQPASASTESSDEWRIIYRLPLIRLASAFNRVKIPYGLLNACVVPASFAMEYSAQLPSGTASLISAVGITSWLTLAIFSMAIQNLVGIMYVNDTNDRMKLAYVDYWGKRHDVSINLDDLVPEWEKEKPSKFNFYQTLTLFSNDKVKYKLLQRYGTIEDPETFASIFGE